MYKQIYILFLFLFLIPPAHAGDTASSMVGEYHMIFYPEGWYCGMDIEVYVRGPFIMQARQNHVMQLTYYQYDPDNYLYGRRMFTDNVSVHDGHVHYWIPAEEWIFKNYRTMNHVWLVMIDTNTIDAKADYAGDVLINNNTHVFVFGCNPILMRSTG